MQRLGYGRYFAQGGDWGAAITTAVALQNKGACAGIHVNMPSAGPTAAARENPTERDQQAFAGGRYYQEWGAGYSKQQSTRPQTLGYGLVDSPMGQAAWVVEKFLEWTDCDGHPEKRPEPRGTHRQRDVLLARRQRRVFGAAVLGELQPSLRPGRREPGAAADRLQHLPQGNRADAAQLGGTALRQHRLLERIGQGRPLRRLRAAGVVSWPSCATVFGSCARRRRNHGHHR